MTASTGTDERDLNKERETAEREYTMRSFHYLDAPIGSRDWSLFWDGWLARASLGAAQVPAGWAYERNDFGVWFRHVILNSPDGGAKPPTSHHGNVIRNVRPVYFAEAPAEPERWLAMPATPRTFGVFREKPGTTRGEWARGRTGRERRFRTESAATEYADGLNALQADCRAAVSTLSAGAAQVPAVNRETVIEWLDTNDIEVTDRQLNGLFSATAAQVPSMSKQIEAWTWFDKNGEYRLSPNEPPEGEVALQLTPLAALYQPSQQGTK